MDVCLGFLYFIINFSPLNSFCLKRQHFDIDESVFVISLFNLHLNFSDKVVSSQFYWVTRFNLCFNLSITCNLLGTDSHQEPQSDLHETSPVIFQSGYVRTMFLSQWNFVCESMELCFSDNEILFLSQWNFVSQSMELCL